MSIEEFKKYLPIDDTKYDKLIRDGYNGYKLISGYSGNVYLGYDNKNIKALNGDKKNEIILELNALTAPLGVPPSNNIIIQRPHSGTFIVDVLYNDAHEKIYKCPHCNVITGTYAPMHPTVFSYFSHARGCPNTNKIPVEEPTSGGRGKHKSRHNKKNRKTKKTKKNRRKSFRRR